MSYADTRDDEQLRKLDAAIDKFKEIYPRSARQTVIFFPGALASKLKRAKTPFRKNVSTTQTFEYDELWLNWQTFIHPDLNALKLKLHKEEDGVYHDEEDRIVVADGPIEFENISPYDGFVDWCEENKIDLFIFGWDWRRRLEETVDFFLNKFLLHFQKRVMDGGGPSDRKPDPLENLTLIGHSFGGMVVKLILEKSPDDQRASKIKRAITVATPFYGVGGQMHRWFEGEPLLNHLGKSNLIRTLASLPSCYALNWLSVKIFNENKPHFDEGLKYPCVDATTGDNVDPYAPENLRRYPIHLGFSSKELEAGATTSRNVAQKLSDDLALKFFNIRGVQKTLDNDLTINGTTFGLIDPNFDPDGESPIMNVTPLGKGDQVLSAFTTHLATLPPGNRKTVEGTLHHSFMMSFPEVQKEIAGILGMNSVTGDAPVLEQPDLAEAQNFVQELQDKFVVALKAENPLSALNPLLAFLDRFISGMNAAKFGDFLQQLEELPEALKRNLKIDRALGIALGGAAQVQGLFPQGLSVQERKKRIVRQIMMGLCR